MFLSYAVAPATVAANGLPPAVLVGVSVIVLAATGLAVLALHRSGRLPGLRSPQRSPRGLLAAVGSVCAVAVLVGSVLVGGSLTRPPIEGTDGGPGSRALAQPASSLKLTGLQLPTL